MLPNNDRNSSRQAIVEAARGKLKRSERRRRIVVFGTGAAIVAALVTAIVFVFIGGQQELAKPNTTATTPIEGVESFPGLGREHVVNTVAFPALPPVGGDHSVELTNCGVYTQPVDTWRAVHSLEHGAVWVAYRPELPAAQLELLTAQAHSNSYELLSPYPDLPSSIVASAWGKRLQVESADDPRLADFLATYLQGPQTPEPGAPCSGGVQG